MSEGLEIMREGNPPDGTYAGVVGVAIERVPDLTKDFVTPLRRAMGFTERLLPAVAQDEITGVGPRMEAHASYWPGWWT